MREEKILSRRFLFISLYMCDESDIFANYVGIPLSGTRKTAKNRLDIVVSRMLLQLHNVSMRYKKW